MFSWSILQHFWPALSGYWSWKPIFGLLFSDLLRQVLFVRFDSLRPINNLSVIKGRVFLGWTSTKLGLMFLLKDTTQWPRWCSNPRPLCLESSTLLLSHCAPQKSLETEFSVAICCQSGDKWELKTLFLAIFDLHMSIVKSIFILSVVPIIVRYM